VAIPQESAQLRHEEDTFAEAEGILSVVSCIKNYTHLVAIFPVKGDNLC